VNDLKHDEWAGTTFGNKWMHRWLIKLLRVVDMRLIYVFAFVFVVPPTLVINTKARHAIFRFYRDKLKLSWLRAGLMTYKNHCAFAQVVIDRFAMYAGKHFEIEIDGIENFQKLVDSNAGFVQISSHIGNYELAGYSLATPHKRFNALVFGGEKASVMANRAKMFDRNNIRMIAMEPDMSHLFLLNQALSDGEIVSMPADRVFGSQKTFGIEFLDGKAKFPQGPFVVAATRGVAMLFVAVMKVSVKKYHITVRNLEPQAEGNARVKARDLAERYVALLTETIEKYPAQWYNYYDIWESNGVRTD
jgi:predicted LPLAT superfamily acyltransferase